MKVTLILLGPDGERSMSIYWPKDVRIPAVGERLLLGPVGEQTGEPTVSGLVRAVTWVRRTVVAVSGLEVDLAVRLDS